MKTVPDENECTTGTHSCACDTGVIGCRSSCINNGGSYECACNAGFMLDVDRLTCVGMYVEDNMGGIEYSVIHPHSTIDLLYYQMPMSVLLAPAAVTVLLVWQPLDALMLVRTMLVPTPVHAQLDSILLLMESHALVRFDHKSGFHN